MLNGDGRSKGGDIFLDEDFCVESVGGGGDTWATLITL